ncbi:3'-5' exonuclease [Cladochytrium tenue]|nr:3'-5' exonuclease [Cladochytrium tenue]
MPVPTEKARKAALKAAKVVAVAATHSAGDVLTPSAKSQVVVSGPGRGAADQAADGAEDAGLAVSNTNNQAGAAAVASEKKASKKQKKKRVEKLVSYAADAVADTDSTREDGEARAPEPAGDARSATSSLPPSTAATAPASTTTATTTSAPTESATATAPSAPVVSVVKVKPFEPSAPRWWDTPEGKANPIAPLFAKYAGALEHPGAAAATPATAPPLARLVAVDCEMVTVRRSTKVGDDQAALYTDALARVSVVAFDGSIILDTFTKPKDPIVDYRSQWSGVYPIHMETAPPVSEVLAVVKELLQDCVVVGQSVDHDLEMVDVNPTEVVLRDTAFFFKQYHPWGHIPSLKRLATWNLGIDIQGGTFGHDSVVDSRVSMLLYLQIRDTWETILNEPSQPVPRPPDSRLPKGFVAAMTESLKKGPPPGHVETPATAADAGLPEPPPFFVANAHSSHTVALPVILDTKENLKRLGSAAIAAAYYPQFADAQALVRRKPGDQPLVRFAGPPAYLVPLDTPIPLSALPPPPISVSKFLGEKVDTSKPGLRKRLKQEKKAAKSAPPPGTDASATATAAASATTTATANASATAAPTGAVANAAVKQQQPPKKESDISAEVPNTASRPKKTPKVDLRGWKQKKLQKALAAAQLRLKQQEEELRRSRPAGDQAAPAPPAAAAATANGKSKKRPVPADHETAAATPAATGGKPKKRTAGAVDGNAGAVTTPVAANGKPAKRAAATEADTASQRPVKKARQATAAAAVATPKSSEEGVKEKKKKKKDKGASLASR